MQKGLAHTIVLCRGKISCIEKKTVGIWVKALRKSFYCKILSLHIGRSSGEPKHFQTGLQELMANILGILRTSY